MALLGWFSVIWRRLGITNLKTIKMKRIAKNIFVAAIISLVATSIMGFINGSLEITGNTLKGFNVQSDLLLWTFNINIAVIVFIVVIILLSLLKKSENLKIN
ncbi:MAG: hypothetical protein NTY12_04685 [Candidatus Falkowbacteria bacterium]|nr:hypothetical protein [Candidatus Falkowbacteria bacterium]